MHPTLKTMVNGELIELPGTIATIRPTVPPELRDQFDTEVETAPAAQLPTVLVRWALAGSAANQEDDALFARLEAGEDIGAVEADDDARGAA
ncbi:hypothetical protein [Streptomyces bohaiensis]|uniref:AbrB/MazE/SpoVT family DNA-binding domain-containing protein n=1 Tax=Streptomyces bohaiensis TaxID=1431344 RepID=A0ABX1C2L4_9ACTN|nr:hypothetical protein [Streptomyces bohaiensis]NJQ13487.1 hypothetical protein [Streptomyces bohaiensis]